MSGTNEHANLFERMFDGDAPDQTILLVCQQMMQTTQTRRSIMVTLVKKIVMGLVLLGIATTAATTGAFADAPGGAYIQCNGGPSSPVRCTPDSW
jgi:hypothetical protein